MHSLHYTITLVRIGFHTHSSARRRRRKAPGKFEGTYSSFSGGQDFTAAKGEGIPIRNIGPIVRRLNAAHGGAAELRLLHAAIYGNEGNQATRKEQLLDFQGLKGESAAANDNVRSTVYMLECFRMLCLHLNCLTPAGHVLVA